MSDTAATAPTSAPYASWGRRIVALVIDWAASTLVAIAVVRSSTYPGWLPLAVFFVESTLGTTLVGGSFGQLATGIRVLRTDGQPMNLLLAVVRQMLICVVIPPLIFQSATGRGLHDMWTGSAAYRPARPR